MVRAPAARAHPPLHRQAPARRDRAGRGARLPALPVRLAARRRRRADGRAGCGRRRGRPARRLRGAGRRLGDRDPAGAPRRLRAGLARRPLPRRARRLGAAAAARASGTAQQRTTERQRARRRRRCAPRRSRCWRAGTPRSGRSLSTRRRTSQPSGRAQAVARLHPRSRARRSSTSWSTAPACCAPQVEEALAELVALGLVDLRQLRRLARAAGAVRPSAGRSPARAAGVAPRRSAWRTPAAGRSRAVRGRRSGRARMRAPRQAVEHVARTLLRRYGVVFWRLLEREADWLPPWRDLLRVYRRLESARRDPRRPLRRRLLRRAVRAARGDRRCCARCGASRPRARWSRCPAPIRSTSWAS